MFARASGPVCSPDSFVAPVRHSGPLITQCHNCKTRRKRIPSLFDSRTRAFRKAKPNSIPIDPTASAANASGSVQTTLSKLPRATHLRTIRLFPRGSPDRVLTFLDSFRLADQPPRNGPMRYTIGRPLHMATSTGRLLTGQIDWLLGDGGQNQRRFILPVTARCEHRHIQMDTRPVILL